MTKVQLTYTFDSEDELLRFLGRREPPRPRIAPDDLPDRGVDSSDADKQRTAYQSAQDDSRVAHGVSEQPIVFGLQPLPPTVQVNVTQVVASDPLHHAVEEFEATLTRAPSSAAAGAPSTVPAAPTSTITPPPAPPGPAPSTAGQVAAPQGAAVQPPPASGVETDSAGMPWDKRIHASTRGTNKDGTWRQKRELDPTVKTNVEAELRGLLALNAAAGSPVPPAPPATAGESAALSPPPSDGGGFAALLQEVVGPGLATGKLTIEQCDAAAAKHGVANWSQVVLTPKLVPAIRAELEAIVKGTGA